MNSVAKSVIVSLAAALLIAVRPAGGRAGAACISAIMAVLESFNGTTATRTIGKELERLGELGENARPEQGPAPVAFIEDRSPVLQGRDEHDVIPILCALALGVLARIGPPPEAALLIAEQLDESYDPRSIAAAACAFKRLPGPKKWGLRGLITALRSEMMDEPLCLECDTEGIPFGQLTTMRLEVLGSVRSGPMCVALPVVAAEANSAVRAGTFHARIRQEAIKTLGEIESSIRKDASTAEPLCAGASRPTPRRWSIRPGSLPGGAEKCAFDDREIHLAGRP